ncbi:MAG TPA: hypothetical protein VLH38_05820 [Patescibacteria group bacterium]|nr:hypothetical protein [Patescibacteria group bacterium]
MLPEPLYTIKKYPLRSLYVAGLLLLAVGGWIWWSTVSIQPERVFWDTVEQSLSTSAVTIQAEQSNNGSSLNQTVQYSLGATNMSHSLTSLRQNGTTVVDELVGTPSADYTRYINVQTNQKNKSGKPLNFNGIIGVWAKSDGKSAVPQLFGQAVLGTGLPIGGVAIPIANLESVQRAKLIKEIRDDSVYQVKYSTVKKQRINGRLQYVYAVDVQPVSYAALMQRFAQLMGIHALDQLDPASFKGQEASHLQLTIDVRSRHVVSAGVSAVKAAQTYSAYDVPVTITVPTRTITVQALQQRLTKMQQ